MTEKAKQLGNEPANFTTEKQMDKVGCEYEVCNIGLTKREYFAGLAMQGLLSQNYTNRKDIKTFVRWAAEAADALLEELTKCNTKKVKYSNNA
jgi:hypothetical protein